MSFRVLYKDAEGGRNCTQIFETEEAKNAFCQTLTKAGIECNVQTAEAKRWHVVQVALNHDDIEDIISGKKHAYSFGDQYEVAKEKDIVKVRCVDGRVKIGTAISVWKATAQEIQEFKASIGYEHLGLVLEKIM